jgi:hypothetical protein
VASFGRSGVDLSGSVTREFIGLLKIHYRHHRSQSLGCNMNMFSPG